MSKTESELERVSRLCRTIAELEPQNPNVELLREILGDFKFTRLAEIATAFGLSSNTIRQSWRQSGMPGEHNAYPAAEVVAWLIERNLRNQHPGYQLCESE